MIAQEMIDKIVGEHFEIEDDLEAIAVYSSPQDNELRLIEVNKGALPTGKVEPFYMSPQEDFPVPIFIADVTPEEWEKIEQGVIKPPKGWPQNRFQFILRKK